MERYRAGLFNHALLRSLATIRAAKTQLHSLTSRSSTPAVLASQIDLCDVLLDEIRAIRCNFEKRMSRRGTILLDGHAVSTTGISPFRRSLDRSVGRCDKSSATTRGVNKARRQF